MSKSSGNDSLMWAYLIHLGMNMWGDYEGAYTPCRSRLETDDEVWKKVIDFLPTQGINTVLIDVGEALQYETHPEIAIPGAWSKDKMKKELDRIRSLGMTPIPKLNFSAGHDVWLGVYSRMVSTPEYYRVCKDLIKEVAEVFGYPEYFHLGMDEETAGGNNLFICVRQGELWWHDAYYLFDACESVGARPWVWSDKYWHCGEEYLEKMPKSVLQSNWYYGRITKNADGSYTKKDVEAYRDLEKVGFDQVPTCSTWANKVNTEQTVRLGKEEIAPERLKGFMTAPWAFTVEQDYYTLLDDANRLGQAKKKLYTEA